MERIFRPKTGMYEGTIGHSFIRSLHCSPVAKGKGEVRERRRGQDEELMGLTYIEQVVKTNRMAAMTNFMAWRECVLEAC